jgi:large subunit ribosomal protein LP0
VQYLQTFDKAFVVNADNVGSKQFMDIRKVRSACCINRRASAMLRSSSWTGAMGDTACLFLQALRPNAVILMGKNTMMRYCVEKYLEETGDNKWECLVKPGRKGLLEGNVGIVFTNGDLAQVGRTAGNRSVVGTLRLGCCRLPAIECCVRLFRTRSVAEPA